VSRKQRLEALASLEGSVGQLLDRVATLSRRVQQLEAEKGALEEEVAKLKERLKVSSEEIKVLTAATTLSSDPDRSKEARKLIAQVLREIESCITLLQA